MREVRWGIIGCGQIGLEKIVPAIAAAGNAHLAAVADVRTERLEMAHEYHPTAVLYPDYKELLDASDIDAVYIALPNQFHHPITVEAAQHEKHILCEKPLGLDGGQVRDMIINSEANGVKLMAGYMARFGDAFLEAKRLLINGRLGRITMVNANFSINALTLYPPDHPGSWRWNRENGGPLMEAGINLTFALRELMGTQISRVSANMQTVIAKEQNIPDTITAWFTFNDGTPGTLTTTFTHDESSLVFHGTEGVLRLEDCFASHPGGRMSCHARSYRYEFETDLDQIDHFNNYKRQVEHFSNAILNDNRYIPSPYDALDDIALLDTIAESARTGQIIEVR